MRILLTGAFGNVGTSIIRALTPRRDEVVCFDLPGDAARQAAASLPPNFTVQWGNLADQKLLHRIMADVDVVLHIAAIIPPLSEKQPELARLVNIGGTANLIAAALRQAQPPRFLLASSVSVHGSCAGHSAPVRADTLLVPTDSYNTTKIAAEKLLREAGLRWSILRLGAVHPLALQQFDPLMFEISLDSRVEFVHTWDVGLAFANAAERPEVDGKILMIGGGPANQYEYGDYYTRFLDAVGVGMFPATAFSHQPFYTDWMDSREAQDLLEFQHYNFTDYLDQIRDLLGWRYHLARLFRPVVRWQMLRQSPYYRHPQPLPQELPA